MHCNHPDSDKYEICGTLSCPKCYYETLMNPTPQELAYANKHAGMHMIYIYSPDKHGYVAEMVVPSDPRYETGLREVPKRKH